MHEVAFEHVGGGNPFDLDVAVEFRAPSGRTVRVGAFHDGDNRYLARLLPDEAGDWSYASPLGSGSFHIGQTASPGPVRVDGQFHFRYSDGTRYTPFGTTAYAWTHQGDALAEQTLATLKAAPFNKIRMCVFPKSYAYNQNEPELFPFPRNDDGTWDTSRFDVEFFRHLERRIDRLNGLGVEADLILFHPYDRWGFADLGPDVDERYVRYLVRRLAALPNVWWALANEYDLMKAKDWERIAEVVRAEDHVGHLRSIHNCVEFYDHGRPWITHASVQRVDTYRTAENTDAWRLRWGKPVVVDECGYEGDLEYGWGNLTAEELVRRCWEGAIRGGYVQHGETYLDPADVIWWAKGGVLKGQSVDRIRFLAEVVAASPTGTLDPLPSEWDVPAGGVGTDYVILYFGFNRPSFRTVALPPGRGYLVDVIDTWAMTVERLPGEFRDSVTVPLGARQFRAIRLVAKG